MQLGCVCITCNPFAFGYIGFFRYGGRAPICRNSLYSNDLRQKKVTNNYFNILLRFTIDLVEI